MSSVNRYDIRDQYILLSLNSRNTALSVVVVVVVNISYVNVNMSVTTSITYVCKQPKYGINSYLL